MEIVPERVEICKTCKYRHRDESEEPCAHCTRMQLTTMSQ